MSSRQTYSVPAGPTNPSTPKNEGHRLLAGPAEQEDVGNKVEYQIDTLNGSFCEDQDSDPLLSWVPGKQGMKSDDAQSPPVGNGTAHDNATNISCRSHMRFWADQQLKQCCTCSVSCWQDINNTESVKMTVNSLGVCQSHDEVCPNDRK